MTELTLAKAQIAVNAALAYARENSLAPMTVAVLDDRGVLNAFAAEDGTPLRRADTLRSARRMAPSRWT